MTGTALPRDAGRWLGQLIRACGVVAVSLSAAGGALVLGSRPLLSTRAQLAGSVPWSALPLDLLLGCLAATALAFCAVWLVAVTTATAVEALTGASHAVVRAASPHVVRRLVLVCCGAAVGGTSVLSPAAAATGPGSPPPVVRVAGAAEEPGRARTTLAVRTALTGLGLPDRAEGGAPPQREEKRLRPRTAGSRQADEAEARPPRPDTSGETARAAVVTHALHGTHRVRTGESLWSIAEEMLPGAGPSRLDGLWRRIYRVNRRDIGADPDLIVPGATLLLPVTAPKQPLDRPGDRGSYPHRKDAS